MSNDRTTTAHDLALTGREATSRLREIAAEIVAGDGAKLLRTVLGPPPAFVCAAFPEIADGELGRISTLLVWGMIIQHSTSATAIERRRRLTNIFTQSTTETTDSAGSAGSAGGDQR